VKKLVAISAAAIALVALGLPAFAQEPDPASHICREAKASETPSAQMLGPEHTPLVCRSVAELDNGGLKNVGSVTVQTPNIMLFPYYASKAQLQDPALWQQFWNRVLPPGGP
jgi:hypothetical protein